MSKEVLIEDLLRDIEALADGAANHGLKHHLMARIRCAAEALIGIGKTVDTGPWEVAPDGRVLSSDDFDHDVQLRVSGDFYSDEQRRAYSQALALRLNQLPKEPPPGLLWSMAMRLHHNFGIDADDSSPMSGGWTERDRERVLVDMRRLYDEVAGHGFYQWP